MMDWEEEITDLTNAAYREKENDRPIEAYRILKQALGLLPPSAGRSSFATEILTALGEIKYLNGELDEAFEFFSEAVKCEGGLGLSQIHLRLGQIRAERGDLDRAQDELMRAYMDSGKSIFDIEDPKYYALIKDIVEKGKKI